MIDERTGKDLKDLPILEGSQNYIYIMLNSDNKVKIGKTRNIYKRYLSLCGSNSQGNKITNVFCSEGTYIYSIESVMHNKFHRYRIPNTEWFYNTEDCVWGTLYQKAIEELKLLFSSDSYETLNEMRKIADRKKTIGGDANDD